MNGLNVSSSAFKSIAINRPSVNVSPAFLKAVNAVSAWITKSVTLSPLAFCNEKAGSGALAIHRGEADYI